jgi:5-methylcytosine-specific restriction endonuclease McrA
MLADKRRYKEENREKILADQRCDYADHREQYRAYYRHWQKENPEVGKAKQARREARKRNLPDTLTSEQAEHLLVIGKAMYPGEKLHLDHIVPLSKGGGTTLANMHAIPARLNCSKYDKLPGETYKQGTLI